MRRPGQRYERSSIRIPAARRGHCVVERGAEVARFEFIMAVTGSSPGENVDSREPPDLHEVVVCFSRPELRRSDRRFRSTDSLSSRCSPFVTGSSAPDPSSTRSARRRTPRALESARRRERLRARAGQGSAGEDIAFEAVPRSDHRGARRSGRPHARRCHGGRVARGEGAPATSRRRDGGGLRGGALRGTPRPRGHACEGAIARTTVHGPRYPPASELNPVPHEEALPVAAGADALELLGGAPRLRREEVRHHRADQPVPAEKTRAIRSPRSQR